MAEAAASLRSLWSLTVAMAGGDVTSDQSWARRSPTVKGSRSAENMCMSWPFHPRSDTNALMMSTEPMVKQMANLEGARMMMGRNSENARMENSRPAPIRAMNQVKFMVFGIADCALQCRTANLALVCSNTLPEQTNGNVTMEVCMSLCMLKPPTCTAVCVCMIKFKKGMLQKAHRLNPAERASNNVRASEI